MNKLKSHTTVSIRGEGSSERLSNFIIFCLVLFSMSLIDDAFKEFIGNIGVILPVIIITVIGYVFIIALPHFLPSRAVEVLSPFILGLTLAYSASASLGTYLFRKVGAFLDYLSPSTVIGLILGLFLLIFSLLPGILSLLANGLAFSFTALLFPSVYKGRGVNVGETIDWISRSMGLDFVSFLLLYVFCLLSFLPVIDVVAIPLSLILAYLMRARM